MQRWGQKEHEKLPVSHSVAAGLMTYLVPSSCTGTSAARLAGLLSAVNCSLDGRFLLLGLQRYIRIEQGTGRSE